MLSARILIFLTASVLLSAAPYRQESVEGDCLKYSDPNTLKPLKKYKHPAMDKGCVSCHLDCREVPPKKDRQAMPAYYLKASQPALCLECHAKSKKDLSVAHNNYPLGQVQCTKCHDPHSGNSPLRIPDFSHGPYDVRLCSECHAAPVDGKVQLVAAEMDALCYKCHADYKPQIDGAKNWHKLLSQSNAACVECHDPHASNLQHVLKKPVQVLCLGCHGSNAEKAIYKTQPSLLWEGAAGSTPKPSEKLRPIDLSVKHVHKPAGISCIFCHNPHASPFPMELHAPVQDLCLGCHGPGAEKILHSRQSLPLFEGRVGLPPKLFEKLKQIDLSSKYIHKPVEVSCVYCHDAHASDFSMELHTPVHELCIGCHGASAGEIILSRQSLPLFEGRVILPPKPFEKLTGLKLSTDGTGHPIPKHPVYKPATDNKAEVNCLSCHTSHTPASSPHLLVSSRESLCATCHKM